VVQGQHGNTLTLNDICLLEIILTLSSTLWVLGTTQRTLELILNSFNQRVLELILTKILVIGKY